VVVGWAHNRDACWYSVLTVRMISLCGLISDQIRRQITHKHKYSLICFPTWRRFCRCCF